MGPRLGFSLVVLAALGIGSGCGGAAGHAEDEAAWFNLRANVTRVIDSDTLQVRIGRRTVRVLILGIFAPDASGCFGPEAAAAARALAKGKRVRLVGDRTQPRRDRLRRLLAYVTLPNGQDLGRRLIAGGYARVWFGDSFRRLASYEGAERAAIDAGLGLWSACVDPPPGGSADLAVAIADAPDPVVVGSRLTYRIRVANLGPDSADAVRVADRLPPAVEFVGGTISTSELTQTCSMSAATVECGGSLVIVARGRTATVTIVVRPTAAGTITNAATVTSATEDPATASNTASTTTAVTSAAPRRAPSPRLYVISL